MQVLVIPQSTNAYTEDTIYIDRLELTGQVTLVGAANNQFVNLVQHSFKFPVLDKWDLEPFPVLPAEIKEMILEYVIQDRLITGDFCSYLAILTASRGNLKSEYEKFYAMKCVSPREMIRRMRNTCHIMYTILQAYEENFDEDFDVFSNLESTKVCVFEERRGRTISIRPYDAAYWYEIFDHVTIEQSTIMTYYTGHKPSLIAAVRDAEIEDFVEHETRLDVAEFSNLYYPVILLKLSPKHVASHLHLQSWKRIEDILISIYKKAGANPIVRFKRRGLPNDFVKLEHAFKILEPVSTLNFY